MFKKLFNQALAMGKPQAWPTYDGLELDRTEFLTASESGSCIRRAYFSKNPKEYPLPVGYAAGGFAERGHAIEAWLVGKLKPLEDAGWTIEYMGEDQRSFYDSDIGISGTPDGLLTSPEKKKYMMEIKSIDPRANKTRLPKKNHLLQVQQNMFLMERCLGITIEEASLIYIDASDVFDIREFPVSKDEDAEERIRSRAEDLWSASKPDNLEPEGVYNGDCDYCQFTRHCSQVVNMQKTLERLGDAAVPFFGVAGEGETEDMDAEQQMAVEQWIDGWEGAKRYGEDKSEVDDEVKKLVVDRGGRIQHDGWQLSATMMAGRETVDKKALETDGIDLEKYTKVGKPFVTIKVTPPMEDE